MGVTSEEHYENNDSKIDVANVAHVDEVTFEKKRKLKRRKCDCPPRQPRRE